MASTALPGGTFKLADGLILTRIIRGLKIRPLLRI
jgi:hypothetical protein